MFDATELLGRLLQSGVARSSADRMRHALGPQGLGQPGGPLGELFRRTSDPSSDASGGVYGGLAEAARDFIGAGQSSDPRAVGGPLGAGGGVMALLGGLAVSALVGSQPRGAALGPEELAKEAPLGLRAPQDAAEAATLQRSAMLVLGAMINAAKADGQVDQEELQRIVGKLREAGAEAEALEFVMSELRKPMDLEGLLAQVPDERVAVQLYAASLLAIEVGTEAERRYLRRLAHGLGLAAGVVRYVHETLGMDRA